MDSSTPVVSDDVASGTHPSVRSVRLRTQVSRGCRPRQEVYHPSTQLAAWLDVHLIRRRSSETLRKQEEHTTLEGLETVPLPRRPTHPPSRQLQEIDREGWQPVGRHQVVYLLPLGCDGARLAVPEEAI